MLLYTSSNTVIITIERENQRIRSNRWRTLKRSCIWLTKGSVTKELDVCFPNKMKKHQVVVNGNKAKALLPNLVQCKKYFGAEPNLCFIS
jgi:hypothetical protein